MCMRTLLTSSVLAAGLWLATGSGNAADLYAPTAVPDYDAQTGLPAVSDINGKVSILGGWKDDHFHDDGLFAAQGTVSFPLGYRYGLQLDGLVGSMDGHFMGGVSGHLFWRDPSVGLLGVYGSFTHFDHADVQTGRLGLEGEYYLGNVTLEATGGWENINLPSPLHDEDNAYFASHLAYYFTPDFRAYVGYRYESEINMGSIGFEYQLPSSYWPGFAVFGEGRIGDEDFASVWLGVRKYFGQDKSLIRRHREDDPFPWLWLGGPAQFALACQSAIRSFFNEHQYENQQYVGSRDDEKILKALKRTCGDAVSFPSHEYQVHNTYTNNQQ